MATSPNLSRHDLTRLPNYRQKTKHEWSAACPACQTGDDRFLYWPDKGNYFCRQCGLKGFVIEADQSSITPEQRESWKRAEAKRRQNQVETEARMQAGVARLEPMVQQYHRQLAGANGYWTHCGLEPETVRRYRLGYCESCPTLPGYDSYVIPVYQSKKLTTIRHRLTNPPTPGDKYRYHAVGMRAQLFNADALLPGDDEVHFGLLDRGQALLVEGEVKAMFLDQAGITVAGVPGATIWKDEWGQFFERLDTVFVAFDPGANGAAYKTASRLTEVVRRVCLVTLPAKPDDLFVKYGCSMSDFLTMLEQGRVIRP
jgi:DNA primase